MNPRPNSHHLHIRYPGIVPMLTVRVEIGQAFRPGDAVPPVYPFNAIWDTGASGTVITQPIVDALGLKQIGVVQTFTANGAAMAEVYLISLRFPGGVGFMSLRVTKGNLQPPLQVLIGMDVISQGDFSVSNHTGATILDFLHPPQGLEILNEFHVKAKLPPPPPPAPPPPPKPFPGTPRNHLCPCGSGKKYKLCCGK